MNLFKLIITFASIIISVLAIEDNDQELKQFFCELNQFAKVRVQNNLNVFPCDQ